LVGSGIGDRADSIVVIGEKCMNLFAEMFRSKASSTDPLSPGHDERSTFENSILLFRRNCDPVSWREGIIWEKGLISK
jgi:hypothetical protein